MNTIELARLAGAFELHSVEHYEPLSLVGVDRIETFHRLCIEDFVKGVDVEPVGYLSTHTFGPQVFSETFAGVYPDTATSIKSLYTAEQMAAQRHKALEEAAEVVLKECDRWEEPRIGLICAAAIRALKEKA